MNTVNLTEQVAVAMRARINETLAFGRMEGDENRRELLDALSVQASNASDEKWANPLVNARAYMTQQAIDRYDRDLRVGQ